MRRFLFLLGALSNFSSSVSAAEPTAEQRFQALDARIKMLEAEAKKAQEQAVAALAVAEAAKAELETIRGAQHATATVQTTPVTVTENATTAPAGANGNAFNPAMSVILNGVYAHHSLSPDRYTRSGFPLVDGTGPGDQGLSLGESEVSLAANIDDKFYGQFTLSYEDDAGAAQASIEEAYIDTTALPEGFTVRAGRFFSNLGYLNSHHSHTDNFTDRPLAYQAFLANQYGDDGVQLRWVAPTDFFLELGGELFRGENFPTGGANHAGIGARTLFAHAGGEVGTDHSWLAGVSMLKANTTEAEDGFAGDNSLYIADLTWKWAPQGNTKDGGVTLRGEYFLDDRDGEFFSLADPSQNQPWVGKRRGAYLEGVYRFNRTWDAGYRYDQLWAGRSGPYNPIFDPLRHSVMLTWHNGEFSLLRLQYSHDEPNPNDTDNALYLQYQVSLGAHGAHKF